MADLPISSDPSISDPNDIQEIPILAAGVNKKITYTDLISDLNASDIQDFDTEVSNNATVVQNVSDISTNNSDISTNTADIVTIRANTDKTGSSGLISGGSPTNNGDGTINVSAGTGFIRASDDILVSILPAVWAQATNLALTDLSFNYIYVEYNGGSNQVVATTTLRADRQTNILLLGVYRDGNEIHLTAEIKDSIGDAPKKMIDRWNATEPFRRANGAITAESGTRNIRNTAGTFYLGLNKIITILQDTSGASPDLNHTFEYFYYDGANWITHEEAVGSEVFTGAGLDDMTSGGTFVGSHTIRIHVEIDSTGATDTFKWSYKDNDGVTVIETTGVSIVGGAMNLIDGANVTFLAVTGHTLGDAWDFDCTLSSQIDNTQYNNIASGLVTLANNKYGVHWIYLDVHGHIAVLFGQGEYTLTEAGDAEIPASVPAEFMGHTGLIAKAIIQKNDSSLTSIDNNYNQNFQGSSSVSHNNTGGLQGGTANEYYHLTATEHGYIDQDVKATADVTFNSLELVSDFQLNEDMGIMADSALSADGKYSANDAETGTLGETVVFGNTLYFNVSDSKWYKTDSLDEAKSGNVKIRFCALAGVANDPTVLIKSGKIRADSLFPALTIAAPIYLNGAGLISLTAPTTGFVRVVGYANTADEIDIDISNEYHELGDWTMTIQDDSLSDAEGQTYSIQKGRFKKKGALVEFRGYLVSTGTGTLTGANTAVVGGLPYTSSSVANTFSTCSVGQSGGLAITAGHSLSGYINPNTNHIVLQLWDSTTGSSGLTITEFSAGSLMIRGSYEV